MSDEFNTPNRTFKDGHDPMWTGLDRSDDDASSAGGGSMQFYNSSAIRTRDGFLEIRTYLERTKWNRFDHVKKTWKHEQTNFTSGMLQSWNKFCFTGGILEVDIIFPGDPYVGGLWPAAWMLGNLGRATYEASTNGLWPWSFNTCNRTLQDAQTISACNKENHFGMHPHQGRGATEIDLVEVMTGYSKDVLPSTTPPLKFPYGDLTLQVRHYSGQVDSLCAHFAFLSPQVAPGVRHNRPQPGGAPLRRKVVSPTGHTQFPAQIWYDGLEMQGNTSINPFFYGTFLDETKPGEPVTRTKKQAFQADAVGVAHQLTPSHFRKPHTFRLEWQPGKGGRLDWYTKGYRYNETTMITGDGNGQEWVHALSLKDKSLENLMGSQIPIEPSYLIFNVAVSSTWGFPYDAPDWCPKCFDCDDPTCSCAFNPGFCEMIRTGKTAMYIDHIRVYQSSDASVHVGANHTLGCDPPEYPTAEWIKGHSYRYMRNAPFSYDDLHPLRRVQRGGGKCKTDRDCGGTRGKCVSTFSAGFFSSMQSVGPVCSCHSGYTGPNCLAIDHVDDSPSAYKIKTQDSPFQRVPSFAVPNFMLASLAALLSSLVVVLFIRIQEKNVSLSLTPDKFPLIPSEAGL